MYNIRNLNLCSFKWNFDQMVSVIAHTLLRAKWKIVHNFSVHSSGYPVNFRVNFFAPALEKLEEIDMENVWSQQDGTTQREHQYAGIERNVPLISMRGGIPQIWHRAIFYSRGAMCNLRFLNIVQRPWKIRKKKFTRKFAEYPEKCSIKLCKTIRFARSGVGTITDTVWPTFCLKLHKFKFPMLCI